MLTFIYSEKATNFYEISTLLLSYQNLPIKSKVKISQSFVAFSEYMNFMSIWKEPLSIKFIYSVYSEKVTKIWRNPQILLEIT